MFGIKEMGEGTFFLNFLYSLLATIIGGVILSIIFFLMKEKIFSLRDINGCWHFSITTKTTEYLPFQGMVLRYIAVIWQEGPYIKGTLEKVYEHSSTGERSFIGRNRTRGIITGYLEKNYISKDRIVMHIIESGHGREYTHFYKLIFTSNDIMTGDFSSTAAEQTGHAIWQRKKF